MGIGSLKFEPGLVFYFINDNVCICKKKTNGKKIVGT